MVEAELKSRCEVLASVGDEQARCTLVVLKELAEARKELGAVAGLGKSKSEENAIYTLSKIAATIDLARELGVLPKKELTKKQEADKFVGVKVDGKVIDGIVPRDFAHVPNPRNTAELVEALTREPKPGTAPTAEQVAAVQSIAKEFGLAENEAVAAAATRRAMGLPPTMDAAVLTANPETKTGGFEKVPGAKKDGNKE